MTPENLEILMVEDNPADVLLTREAFREGNIASRLNVVKDGVEALAYLRREDPYAAVSRPDLIFLDLNLPRKNGQEVLQEIKTDENFRQIPVIVLTTSSSESDIVKSYQYYANAYVVKPVDMDQFNEALKCIDRFWRRTATLPPR